MEQTIPGIMVAAVKSGSGKTTLTCAILEALKERGLKPCAFKCGPDYIDPMFHRKALGVPSYNLDGFFSGAGQLCEIYARGMKDRDIAVVEGVMGLFDGIGGVREDGSAYHIASILRLPILLVVDAHGMGRSILPLLAGFRLYDKEKLIAGVVLNRITESFYKSIAPVIEEELQLPALGFLPRDGEFSLEGRYLGLKLPEEITDLEKRLHRMAEVLEANVPVGRVLDIAGRAGARPRDDGGGAPYRPQEGGFGLSYRQQEGGPGLSCRQQGSAPRVRIGVAYDEAFCFYYGENLVLLEQNGAELVFFSPLHDKELPEGLGAVLLGGGYPELYAGQLEQNCSMRMSLRRALEDGMPSVAECGGFMYLHDSIVDDQGRVYHMCGVLPGRCFHTGKLVRFGYMELEERGGNFLKDSGRIRGHEFHYYDSEDNGRDCLARKPVTDRSWDCVHSGTNHFWGFPHLYYPSNPGFAEEFVRKAMAYLDLACQGKGKR